MLPMTVYVIECRLLFSELSVAGETKCCRRGRDNKDHC